MAVSSRSNVIFSRIKPFLSLRKYKHSLGENRGETQLVGSDSLMEQGVAGLRQIDMLKWKKLDSRTLGIARNSISESSWIVLKILQTAGFEAYLVGGCVRDLILNKVPKDFDIITTAALKQIKKQFHRCLIVGRRFPICKVQVKGSVIEVSSFDTVARHDKEKKEIVTNIPRGCDKNDFVRWRNCMHRDFTVNSLFFNPFENKIYDYANGMMDLRSLKLRTLIPAHQSLKEDSARILRGLRLSARLGLSLSKETAIAIRGLLTSVASLPKSRIMMEMNYMLSYGASKPSLSLLQQFKLLEILLPLHAAYLGQQAQNNQNSVMLMELFCNLDKLITCDQPSDCNLWVGLLAFHLALVLNPQDALVLCTFASVLYHGNWTEGVKFGREHADRPTVYTPEITEAHYLTSDGELAEKVTQLASAIQYCIGGLSEADTLQKLMARFPDSPCSGLVFVSKGTQKRTSDLFHVLAHDVESYKKERKCFDINFSLLGKGDLCETRFVLGKIILDTMSSGVQSSGDAEEKHERVTSDFANMVKAFGNEKRKRGLPPDTREPQKGAKKNEMILEKCNVSKHESTVKRNRVVNSESNKTTTRKQKMVDKDKEAILCILQTVKDDKHVQSEYNKWQEGTESKLKSVKKNVKEVVHSVGKSNLPQDGNNRGEEASENNDVRGKIEKSNEDDGNERGEKASENNGVKGKIEKRSEDVKGGRHKHPCLSSLFRR